jgi:predicted RNase H-like HicB family nuclease
MPRTYTVILSHDPETGHWLATMPAFEFGAFATYGFTREHALEMAQEWIELNILGLLDDGEPIPEDMHSEVASVVVSVPPSA